MKPQALEKILKDAREKKIAVGHFNISDFAGLKAIFEAAKELAVPVVIGTSEGERSFLGARQAAAAVRSLREEHEFPIFLNADHTHSFEKVKEAVAAGYDAILFDGGKLPLEENIRETKKVVEYVKSKNPTILVEGEIGYIGSSSEVFKEIPEGAAIRPEDLTTAEQAKEFVEKTGVDLLAPAVGNIHGMFANAPNPRLDIARIAEIRVAAGVPLVLHGGSGILDEDFLGAINAGISLVHINTEIRVAWRKGLEEGLKRHPDEISPHKVLPSAVDAVKKVVKARLALFNRIS
ncbi:MAG: class II fructose-bisphosphate aldolase [Candidatus Liptonbacteria bacterium]|nr:class II fructose-bisphosphate aldolase [Candidatus Liptonbacteria bacterium]